MKDMESPKSRPAVLAALKVFVPASLSVLPLAWATTAARAQTTLRTKKVVLGDSDGPGLIGPIVTVARVAPLGYFVSYDANDAEILVFDSLGTFVRTVGRRGSGPGEYQFIRWLRSDGSNLYVFDGRLLRQTVLTADLHVARTTPLPGHLLGDAEPLGDSLTAVNSFVGTVAAAGLLVHVFGATGSVVKSIAEDSAGYRADMSRNAWRPLARARDGEIWIARRGWYRIEKWNVESGRNTLILVNDVPWFPPHVVPSQTSALTKPTPLIEDIYEDQSGRLWILITVADPNWRRAAGPTREGVVTVADRNKFFDSVVEIIDPSTGTLLASRRVPEYLTQFISGGQAISYEEATSGAGRVLVWQLRLNIGTGRVPQ
jgi:hypothetical protein